MNWGGNLCYSAKEIEYPTNEEELRNIILRMKKGKVLGTKHSFNLLADTEGTLISSSKMDRILKLDRENKVVWVESGIKYGDLGKYLDQNGFSLQNLASLPHISVGGAVVTATHGSGDSCSSLASSVEEIEIMLADGNKKTFRKDEQEFYGAVVNIGALGFITKIALKIEEKYNISIRVFENLPMSALNENLDKIYGAGFSVSLFTNWSGSSFHQVWIKSRSSPASSSVLPVNNLSDFFGATPAKRKLHPVGGDHTCENCVEQMGIEGKFNYFILFLFKINLFNFIFLFYFTLIGPSYDRLPHFKMDFTPSSGAELQTEYFIPREHLYEAVLEIQTLGHLISPLVYVTEIRSFSSELFW